MDHMVRKDQEEKELEICISCGTETEVKKTDNIIYRSGYIEGAGQLCFKCSQTRKMHKTGSYETTEWSRYGL
jgi:hypothetical protein